MDVLEQVFSSGFEEPHRGAGIRGRSGIVEYQLRLLEKQEEIRQLIELEREVWGFSEADSDSVLTRKVMSNQLFQMGYTFGAFLGDELFGGSVYFASLVPGRVYGHLVCLKPAFRNKELGTRFLLDSFRFMHQRGVQELFWTYEPLDAGNATVYINKLGGRATRYLPEYIEIEDTINGGVPLDRMVCEVDLSCLDRGSKETVEMEDALQRFPVVGAEGFPVKGRVLLEIPGDYKSLKAGSIEEATRVRLATRELFDEWINRKEYAGVHIVSGKENGVRRNFYLLEREGGD